MNPVFRIFWRIIVFTFNTIRNLSLVFTALVLLFIYSVAQNPEGFAESMQRKTNEVPNYTFSFFGDDDNTDPGESPTIRVGGVRKYEKFELPAFVYLKTSDSHYVELAVRNKFLPKLHGDIKALKRQFPKNASQIFATGSIILNLDYVTSWGQDGITFEVQLDDKRGHSYSLVLPAYKADEFRRAVQKYRR